MAQHLTELPDGKDAPAAEAANAPSVWCKMKRHLASWMDGAFECALAGESVTLCSTEALGAAADHRERCAAAEKKA